MCPLKVKSQNCLTRADMHRLYVRRSVSAAAAAAGCRLHCCPAAGGPNLILTREVFYTSCTTHVKGAELKPQALGKSSSFRHLIMPHVFLVVVVSSSDQKSKKHVKANFPHVRRCFSWSVFQAATRHQGCGQPAFVPPAEQPQIRTRAVVAWSRFVIVRDC